jgi:signal transduction histidine kinase
MAKTGIMASDDWLSFPDLPRAELDQTLGELMRIAGDVLKTQGRLRALLRANQAVAQQLDLPTVLRTIVEVAVELVGAEYGALGVISPNGGLEQFIHVGMPTETADLIGHLPEGHGLLGALIDDPRPITVPHLAEDERSAGFPAHHPTMESFLGVPITVRDAVYGNLYLTNSSNGEFSEADEELAIALAATAGFAIDNARLFAETVRARAWAAATAEVTAALVSTDQSDTVALLSARILELSGADLVFVSLRTDDPNNLFVAVAQGVGAAEIEGITYPIAGSVAGTVIEGGQPRLIAEDEFSSGARNSTLVLGPTMSVPLLARGGILGALTVSRAPGSIPFNSSDLELVADFAGQASVAMELADARADKQRMALLEDRSRIARDLHDHVIQQLFATGLRLQSLIGGLPAGPTAVGIDESITNIDLAISQIRTAIFALSSTQSAQGDTVRHRIIDLVNELGGALENEPQLAFAGPVDTAITGALSDDVLAVIRETLTNTVKHSQARSVSISVTVERGAVSIAIVDDGVGIPPDGRRSGLANIRERAASNSGKLEIDSAPGRTSIVWTGRYAAEEEDH